jgi:hypothetical protein
MTEEQAVEDAVAQIRPLLAGIDPDVQGAILANLVAMWLAGHRQKGQGGQLEPATEWREELLTQFTDLVEQLIPLEDEWIDEQVAAGTMNVRVF